MAQQTKRLTESLKAQFDALQHAKDRAARYAEHDLAETNGSYEEELALDVLAAYADEIDEVLFRRWSQTKVQHANPLVQIIADPGRRLAWALTLTERRTDLKVYEQAILADAWGRIVEFSVAARWEAMGAGDGDAAA